MSRKDIEELRASVVSAHRLIELMGEEKEALGERVDVYQKNYESLRRTLWADHQKMKKQVEKLEEWQDALLRELNDKGILSDDIIYKMSQWVKDRLAMKSAPAGEPPYERNTCPSCGTFNPEGSENCSHCLTLLEPPIDTSACPDCGRVNLGKVTCLCKSKPPADPYCQYCGERGQNCHCDIPPIGQPPAEERRKEADMGIEMLWPEEGGA